MDTFFKMLRPLLLLSGEGRAALTAIAQRIELPKGRTLIQPGSVCDTVYFIEEGLTRTYYRKGGKDITDWLAAEGDFVVSVISFLTAQPDRRGVETLEPCRLIALARRDLEALYNAHHEIERLGRLLMATGLIQVQERFDELHFSTAAERYAGLLARRPGLLNRVPLGIIASYLGITQETLSRIRAQH